MNELIKNNNIPNKNAPLVVRWLVGAFIGFSSSGLLLISNVIIGPTLVGRIYAGQFLILAKLLFEIFDDSNITQQIVGWIVSLFIYFTIWCGVGMLIASGKRNQIILGGVVLILYIILGYSMSDYIALPGMS